MSKYRKVSELILYDAKKVEVAFDNREIYVASLDEQIISVIIKYNNPDGVEFSEYVYRGTFTAKFCGLSDEEYQKAILGAV